MTTLVGTGDNDSLVGGATADSIDGAAGNDTIAGGAGADTLIGGDGSDWIYSGAVSPDFTIPYYDYIPAVPPLMDTGTEADSISGGAGDDTIFAGWGDSVDGGGYDGSGNVLFISFLGAAHGVHADFSPLESGGSVTVDGATITNIQSLSWLEGSNYGDYLVPGSTYAADFTPVYGRGGNDTIVASYYSGLIDGGDGDDSLDGSAAGYGFPIYGGAGNDTIVGGSGYEALDGGDGNDSIAGNYGFDTLRGGAGNDFLDGGSFGDVLQGGSGSDTLYGAGDADSIDGGDDADVLWGDFSLISSENGLWPQSNDDTLAGGAGDDTIHGDAGDDSIDGGAGTDTAVYTGAFADYDFSYDSAGDGYVIADRVADRDGTDTVAGVENFQFADGTRSAASIAAMFGTSGNDSFTGTAGDDRFWGLAGRDTLSGGAGNDTLGGGAGNDSLDGGDGIDTITYADSTDAVTVNLATATAQQTVGAGSDTLVHFENLVGGQGSDSLTGDASNNSIQGGAGNDTLDGNGGTDTLAGGAGDDTYIVRSGTETVDEDADGGTDAVLASASFVLSGNVENLTLIGSAAGGTGNAGNNLISGNASANSLDGAAGNDTLEGGAGADTLEGGDGNDWIYSGTISPPFQSPYYNNPGVAPVLDTGADADSILGGAGDDTIFAGWHDDVDGGASDYAGNALYISFLGATHGVQADFRPLFTTGSTTIDGATITHIQSVPWLEGSNYDDLLAPGSSSGYSGFGPIYGRGGNDTLIGGYYTGLMDGGDGNDSIDATGSIYGFPIYGGAGDDTIVGNYNATSIDGGDGNDSISGGSSVDAGAGNDVVRSSGSIYAGAGNDTVYGSSNTQSIDGGAGDDVLYGIDAQSFYSGGDTLAGGDGNDTIYGSAGNDSVDGGTGTDAAVFQGEFGDYALMYDPATQRFTFTDSAAGRDGSDTLTGVENFQFADGMQSAAAIAAMFGTSGNDSVSGTAGNDRFWGLAGNDTLIGGAGNDTFAGGAGNDSLDGGDGVDTASYADQTGPVTVSLAVTAPQSTGAGSDTLLHFENLEGGQGSDSLDGDTQANVVSGNGGNDTLDGGGGADTLVGGAGDDTYVVRSGAETITERDAQGTDTVVAMVDFALADNLENLLLDGDSAIDGTGNASGNAITGNAAANAIDGADGDDTIAGAGGLDTLAGGAGNDVLYSIHASDGFTNPWYGNPGTPPQFDTGLERQVLVGGAGDDMLFAGYGDDADGGAGYDTLYISFAAAATGVQADFRQLQLGQPLQIGGGTITGIENVGWLEGSDQGDFLAPIGSANFAPVFARGGDDTVIGAYYTGVIDGGDGNDSLDASGSIYAFPVYGGAGNDTIVGNYNGGQLSGGDGNDVIYANRGQIDGDAGADTVVVTGNIADHTLAWDATNRAVTIDSYLMTVQGIEFFQFADVTRQLWELMTPTLGSVFADSMNGGADIDVLKGLAGDDTLNGLGGDDYLEGGGGNDVISGGAGRDTAIYSGAGAVRVDLSIVVAQDTGGAGIDTLASIENLIGGDGNDTLTGSAAANSIDGGAGNDSLYGGPGIDTLTGGAGDDTFVVDTDLDVLVERAVEGTDTVLSSLSWVLGSNFERLTLTGSAITGTGNASDNLIVGNGSANALFGMSGDDTLQGGAGSDTLTGGAGSDMLDGGDGTDHAQYSGKFADYSVARTSTGFAVASNADIDDFDTLVNVERLHFDDFSVALDINGNAGEAYRLYQAAFNRKPDLGGLGYQMHDLDIGVSLWQVASNFIASPEFQSTYGSVDNTQFITLLYRNVLHREPEAAGMQYHLDEFAQGQDRADMLTHFSESPENQVNVIGDIQNGMVYIW